MMSQRGHFLIGAAWGVVIGFAAMVIPILWLGTEGTVGIYSQLAPRVRDIGSMLSHNLQGSVLPFCAVLLVFFLQLRKLQELLNHPDPALEKVVRHEQLLDLCANLFFGIGVIWTAIGMRDALIHGLGDPSAGASAGAFAILQRLVDGGILLALSTTIVGGVGGYMMRVMKSLLVGQALSDVYLKESRSQSAASLQSLQRIEQLLQPDTNTDSKAQAPAHAHLQSQEPCR